MSQVATVTPLPRWILLLCATVLATLAAGYLFAAVAFAHNWYAVTVYTGFGVCCLAGAHHLAGGWRR